MKNSLVLAVFVGHLGISSTLAQDVEKRVVIENTAIVWANWCAAEELFGMIIVRENSQNLRHALFNKKYCESLRSYASKAAMPGASKITLEFGTLNSHEVAHCAVYKRSKFKSCSEIFILRRLQSDSESIDLEQITHDPEPKPAARLRRRITPSTISLPPTEPGYEAFQWMLEHHRKHPW